MKVLLKIFPPEVLSCQVSGFPLEQELASLSNVRSCGATEAAVFYCARIHQAIFNEAYLTFFKTKGKSLPEMESSLAAYDLLPPDSYYFSRGLRLLGNEVRHDTAHLSPMEAELAVLFLIFLLKWFFCDFRHGHRHPHSAIELPATEDPLLSLVCTLATNGFRVETVHALLGENCPHPHHFDTSTTFPLVLLEMLLDNDELEPAARMISELAPLCRDRLAHHKRFLQLKALHLCKRDELHEALRVINEAVAGQKKDETDEDSLAIRGRIYRRLWRRDRRREDLQKCQDEYLKAWTASGHTNNHLGVRAATTSLLLKKRALARNIAEKVRVCLEERRCGISEAGRCLDCGDTLALAQVHLLLGEVRAAEELYLTAFSHHAGQGQRIEAAKGHLKELVHLLELDDGIVRRLAGHC